MTNARVCLRCRTEKPVSEYYEVRKDGNGGRKVCKTCLRAANAEWRKENQMHRKEKLKRGRLMRGFGMTLERFNEMLVEQGHKCSICGSNFPDGAKINVDHDHNTGVVRELLCNKCNLGLGCFDDDVSLFYRATLYIDRHRDRLSHGKSKC